MQVSKSPAILAPRNPTPLGALFRMEETCLPGVASEEDDALDRSMKQSPPVKWEIASLRFALFATTHIKFLGSNEGARNPITLAFFDHRHGGFSLLALIGKTSRATTPKGETIQLGICRYNHSSVTWVSSISGDSFHRASKTIRRRRIALPMFVSW